MTRTTNAFRSASPTPRYDLSAACELRLGRGETAFRLVEDAAGRPGPFPPVGFTATLVVGRGLLFRHRDDGGRRAGLRPSGAGGPDPRPLENPPRLLRARLHPGPVAERRSLERARRRPDRRSGERGGVRAGRVRALGGRPRRRAPPGSRRGSRSRGGARRAARRVLCGGASNVTRVPSAWTRTHGRPAGGVAVPAAPGGVGPGPDSEARTRTRTVLTRPPPGARPRRRGRGASALRASRSPLPARARRAPTGGAPASAPGRRRRTGKARRAGREAPARAPRAPPRPSSARAALAAGKTFTPPNVSRRSEM